MSFARIVLINLSVLQPLGFTGFQHAGLTCVVIAFTLPSQSWVGKLPLSLNLLSPQALLRRLCRLVRGAITQNRPADARHLVRVGDGRLVHPALFAQVVNPAA